MFKINQAYLKLIKKQETLGNKFHDKINQLHNFYLPVCRNLFNQLKSQKKPLIIGLSGGQGSGKSTMSKILKIIFEINYNLNVVNFSIDDFYKTANERKKMSYSVHHLFNTRGVPGTHDTKMLKRSIKDLLKNNFRQIKIPKFDKALDDRANKKLWQKIKKKPNIIIFEGWCVGAEPQKFSKLLSHQNTLEKNEDRKLTWRKKVNNELKTNYKNIFKLIDKKIYLKVPSFKYVLKWRILQERKIRSKLKKKTMTNNEIKRFIMFYERITKNMSKNYKKNDIVFFLDKKHKIKSVRY